MPTFFRHIVISSFIYRNEDDASLKEMNIHLESFYSLYGIVKDVQKRIVEGSLSHSEVAVEVERVNNEEQDASNECGSDNGQFTVILRDAWYFFESVVT